MIRIHSRSITSSVVFPRVKTSRHQYKISILKTPSHFGHYSSRGTRLYNEDKYSANYIKIPARQIDYGNDKQVELDCFVASVFDGHGGDECSNFLQHNFHKEIEDCTQINRISFKNLLNDFCKKIGGYWRKLHKKDEEYCNDLVENNKRFNFHNNSSIVDDLYFRLIKSSLELDLKYLTNFSKAGSTSTSVLLYNMNQKSYFDKDSISKLIVSHIGDTRAILCDKNGIGIPLTTNHHPASPVESKRLSKYTASIMTDSFGEQRFLNYANTRAFGDLMGKSKGISAEPEIKSFVIGDPALIEQQGLQDFTINHGLGQTGGNECFIVLCTDGVTNFASDQEIVDLIMSTNNNRGEKNGNPQICAEEVVKYVESIGGDDNTTCLVIRLNNWGNWPMIDRTGKMREDKLSAGISRMDRR